MIHVLLQRKQILPLGLSQSSVGSEVNTIIFVCFKRLLLLLKLIRTNVHYYSLIGGHVSPCQATEDSAHDDIHVGT